MKWEDDWQDDWQDIQKTDDEIILDELLVAIKISAVVMLTCTSGTFFMWLWGVL